MDYTKDDFTPLGGTTRRYLDKVTGKEISRRQRDNLLSTPHPTPHVRSTTVEGHLVENEKPRPNRLRHYQTRVKAFAQQNSMMLGDVKKNTTFKELNRSATSNLKKLDRLEGKLQESLLKHKLGFLSGGLTEKQYNRMLDKIDESNLSAKEKEKLHNQMNAVRTARMGLGDTFKQLGLKDNNDFSALGDTPNV